jgi:hypothetical protein
LRRFGIPQERILAIDLDAKAGPEDHAACTVRGVDFFRWIRTTSRRFDRIVANPPYVPLRRLSAELVEPLTALQRKNVRSFRLSSNYWCAFLSASLNLLRDGGHLAFVLPAAWEYADYAQDVRQAVFKSFETVNVHRCLEPLFPDVQEGCVVIVARNFAWPATSVNRIEHKSSDDLIAALTAGSPPQVDRTSPVPSFLHQASTKLGDMYSVQIGAVTGAAQFFLLTEETRLQHGLPLSAVVPAVTRARHLVSARMTSARWRELLRGRERVWLFHPTTGGLRSRAVAHYIEFGERTCDLDAYKLRSREPWYCVPLPEAPDGFMSGMTRVGPWISFCGMRDLTATNTLYTLRNRTRISRDERSGWALSLLSSAGRYHASRLGRRYADGLVKYEPRDVASIPLCAPQRTHGAIECYEQAVKAIFEGQPEAAIAIADRFVFGRVHGRAG